MAALPWLRSLMRNLSGRREAEARLEDEVRGYVEMLTDEKVAAGMTKDEARRLALSETGGVVQVTQAVRDGRAGSGLETLVQDVRHGWRMLMRSKGFTLVAVVSLGLGIGANAAIFTVAKTVLLDRLRVRHPEELRMLNWVSGHEQPVPPVWGDVFTTPGGLSSNAFSYPVLEELRKRRDAFADLIAFKDVEVTATVDEAAELAPVEMVSGNAFAALGVEALIGRTLIESDDVEAVAAPVAVIGEGYWARRFGRSAAVLGRVMRLNGVPVTVVGVIPARFTGMAIGKATDVFVPLTMQPAVMPRSQNTTSSLLNNPRSWWVQIVARLRQDVREAQAQAELDVVLRQAAMAELPDAKHMDQLHLVMTPGDRGVDSLRGQYARSSYVLLGLSGLVLLLACVNLANLLLARGAARQREMSTRLALGASRRRILRQVLTESLLLAGLGGLLGLALAYAGRNAIPSMLTGAGDGAAMQVDFDWRVLAFTAGVVLVTGILFGVAPAWQATRAEVGTALKDASHATAGRAGTRLGKGLVVVQIGLSAVLLIGAGLFVRTLINLSHTALGFRTDHLLLFRLGLPRSRYSDAQMMAFDKQLEEKLAAIPGVRSVSFSTIAIVGDGHSGSTFHVTGRPPDKEEVRVQENVVGREFFPTMGIPIVRGRGFEAQDTETSPKVAVVNRALAERFFPGEDPVGKSFEADAEDIAGPVRIVGVAANTRYADLRSETPPIFYLLYRQTAGMGRIVVEMRTAAEPGSVLGQARAAVASLDRDLPLIDVRTMAEQVKTTMVSERIFAQLTSGFGVLALILASIGIYGIMAYAVALRTSEIGIRMALGARAEQVLGMVLREATWMALAGVALGISAALGLTRLVSAMLYGLKASDPATLAGVAVLLVVTSLAAGLGPALRAARVDPMRALRHE